MASSSALKLDMRYKLANVNVMLVDNDERAASLVRQLLFSFGFRKIRLVFDGAEALKQLRISRADLIITEWAIDTVNGLSLVKTIRAAKQDKLIDEYTPIIMLTGRSEKAYVQQARDVGITEFLAKPFSAKTLSDRLVELISNPREFVTTPTFSGPSRRRKGTPPPGTEDRRLPREERIRRDGITAVSIVKPDTRLRDLLGGTSVTEILTDDVIQEAQVELMKSEGDFMHWVRDDIGQLLAAYERLRTTNAPDARAQLIRAAYTIKSQSGMFGYEMGTMVADMLIHYLGEHLTTNENMLVVIHKHIETLEVIVSHQVKDANSHVGLALIDSLNKLIAKFS